MTNRVRRKVGFIDDIHTITTACLHSRFIFAKLSETWIVLLLSYQIWLSSSPVSDTLFGWLLSRIAPPHSLLTQHYYCLLPVSSILLPRHGCFSWLDWAGLINSCFAVARVLLSPCVCSDHHEWWGTYTIITIVITKPQPTAHNKLFYSASAAEAERGSNGSGSSSSKKRRTFDPSHNDHVASQSFGDADVSSSKVPIALQWYTLPHTGHHLHHS